MTFHSVSSAVNARVQPFERSKRKMTCLPPHASQSRATSMPSAVRTRPKSLQIIPTILNDSQTTRDFDAELNAPLCLTSCSSSTIDDADSNLTSSLHASATTPGRRQRRSSFYHSYPLLNLSSSNPIRQGDNPELSTSYDHSDGELKQISDLTSKLFGSSEDLSLEDRSLSSSMLSRDAEQTLHRSS